MKWRLEIEVEVRDRLRETGTLQEGLLDALTLLAPTANFAGQTGAREQTADIGLPSFRCVNITANEIRRR